MMNQQFILSACRACPHSRLVGGEPPNWRGQYCLYKIDNAKPTPGQKLSEVRAKMDVDDLRVLEKCPDEPRAARAAGSI